MRIEKPKRCRWCRYDSRLEPPNQRINTHESCPVHGTPNGILELGWYVDKSGRSWSRKPNPTRWVHEKQIPDHLGRGVLFETLDSNQILKLVQTDQESEE